MNQDMEYFLHLYKVFRSLGITPFDDGDHHFFRRVLCAIYPFLLAFFLICVEGLYIRLCLESYEPTILNLIHVLPECLVDLIIALCCFGSAVRHKKSWRNLVSLLKKFDQRITNPDSNFGFRKYLPFIMFWEFTFAFTGFFSSWAYPQYELILYIVTVPVVYFNVVIFFYVSMDIAKNRYGLLCTHLEMAPRYGRTYQLQLAKLYEPCETLHDIMDLINDVFGWTLLFVHARCFIGTLDAVNEIVNVPSRDLGVYYNASLSMYTSINLVSGCHL